MVSMGWAVRGSACGWCRPQELRRPGGPLVTHSGKDAHALFSPCGPYGFGPSEGLQTKNAPMVGGVRINGWAVRGSNPRPWD